MSAAPIALSLISHTNAGKTTLALWMSAQIGLPVVIARVDAMMSSFLGTTSRNIAQVFSFANRFRCVLLLDELDSLAKVRDDPNEVGEIKRVVNALLQAVNETIEHAAEYLSTASDDRFVHGAKAAAMAARAVSAARILNLSATAIAPVGGGG